MEKKEVALFDLIKIAYRWIYVIIAAMIVFAGAMFIYSENFVVPEYKVNTKYCIQTRGQSIESDVLDSQRTVAYAQLVLGTYIDILDTNDFAEEIASYMNGEINETDTEDMYGNIRKADSESKKKMLAEALTYVAGKEKDYDAKDIKPMITYKSEEEKISFEVIVKSGDPNEAIAVARCIEAIASDYIEYKYPGVGMVTVIDKALPLASRTNDRTLLMTLAGALLGAILAFVIVYFIESADKRVKDPKAVSQKTGLAVIGVIPDMLNEKMQK